MDTSGVTTLNSIVNDVKNELGDYSDSNTLRWLRFAERCVSELSIFHLDSVSTKTVQVNRQLNTAPIPTDMLRMIRIGVRTPNGRIYTLTRDDELSFREEDFSCDAPTDKRSDMQGWVHQSTGGVSELGTYRINYKKRRIELSANANTTSLVVEYVSSGVSIDGVTYVPEIARESIIAYIHWKDLKSRKTPYNERQEAKMEYYEQKKILDDAQSITFDELYDSILAGYSQVVRR